MQYEYRFLNSGIKNIITDSPTLLSAIYANFYYPDINIGPSIEEINKTYELKYPSFNIFLERGNKPYIQDGRYQTKEESINLDNLIKNKITNFYKPENILYVDYNDRTKILYNVLNKIGH